VDAIEQQGARRWPAARAEGASGFALRLTGDPATEPSSDERRAKISDLAEIQVLVPYCCTGMVSMESCENFACDYIRRFPLRFLWSEIEQQKFSDHTEI
jgi:hypothetical protein